jgi:hypothetical protein
MSCYIYSDSIKAASCRATLRDTSLLICQRIQDDWLLRIAWCPTYKGILGNEEANTAARQATATQGKLTAPIDMRTRELKGVLQLIERDRRKESTLTRSHRSNG